LNERLKAKGVCVDPYRILLHCHAIFPPWELKSQATGETHHKLSATRFRSIELTYSDRDL